MNNARRLMEKILASQLYAEMIERGRGAGIFMALRKGIEILSEFLPNRHAWVNFHQRLNFGGLAHDIL